MVHLKCLKIWTTSWENMFMPYVSNKDTKCLNKHGHQWRLPLVINPLFNTTIHSIKDERRNSIYLSACLPAEDVILSIYLSIRASVSIPIEIGPHPTHNTHLYPYPVLPLSLLKLDRNDSGPKRLRAETTHLLRPKWPTPKIGRNDPDSRFNSQAWRTPRIA